MNINSLSTNYYQSSLYSTKTSTYSITDETDDQKVGGAGMPPQGPPQMKPPEEASGSDESKKDFSWTSDDLAKYVSYANDEYGVELDEEELMTTFDSDGDGVLSSTEMDALFEETGIAPQKPPEPPIQNSIEDQMNFMAQMQSTSSSINLADYLTDEDDETKVDTTNTSTSTDSQNNLSISAQRLRDILYDTYASTETNSLKESLPFLA